MSITIRKVTKDDIELIQRFGFELLEYERQGWDPTLEPDWPFSESGKKYYEMAIDKGYVTVAEDEENGERQPVGFLIGRVSPASRDAARVMATAHLHNIFVYPDYREKNVGRQLFEDFKSRCKKEGVKKINVTVNAKNTTAINFYEKIDFDTSHLILSQELK